MSELVRPLCSWTGVNPEGDEIVACDRRATSAIVASDGRRLYTCDEHVASAKARASSGFRESSLTHSRHPHHGPAPGVYLSLVTPG